MVREISSLILSRFSSGLLPWGRYIIYDIFVTSLPSCLPAIQTCVNLLRQGRPAPHRESRQKRRELRLKQQAEQEELELRMRELQTANEVKQLELENMRKVRMHTAAVTGVDRVSIKPLTGLTTVV